MKKSLFFVAAASALMLTACSSESDVVQSATPQTQTTVQEQAVGFNVYTPAATGVTRAGLEGTMTTTRMQRTETDGGGFGVYAFLTEDADNDGGTSESAAAATAYARGNGTDPNVPNFMVNEEVLWNATNLGWYYNPLKYWPNETDNDSQSTPAYMQTSTANQHLDRLTFFAYAPYVSGDDGSTGITNITDKDGKLNTTGIPTDPTIAWKATANVAKWNPNEGVDLLWGVAPSGGLSYTAVNGWTVTRNEGTPLLNMIKPNVNTSMKFLFQHALARFGINVVAAVDQVSPGGELDPNTKITINSLTITGPFGTSGELNLNNDGHPSVANWTKINSTPINKTTVDLDNTTSITVLANDATATNNYIAENLRWKADASKPHEKPVAQTVVGVTPAKQDLLAPSTKWFNKLASAPTYNPAKVYYTDAAGTTPAVAKYTTTKKGECYTSTTAGKYDVVNAGTAINAPVYPSYEIDGESDYYTVTEDKTFSGNHVNTYSFNSYGASDKSITYGSGTVKVVSKDTDAGTTTVEVLTNSVGGFVGNKYVVMATDLANVSGVLQLYDPANLSSPLPIWVEIVTATYGYSDADLDPDAIVYRKRNNGTTANPVWWYEYKGTKSAVSWGASDNSTYVTLNASKINVNDFNYAYDTTGDYYEAERNYLYVVPTNAALGENFGNVTTNADKLRTITVQIEYYINTKDDKLAAGFAETKNIITKEVVLPSLSNGKTYMLNLVLGLTSVKIEAEVSDWKVENVQADLPQNTAE